jgi:hypothetical protein
MKVITSQIYDFNFGKWYNVSFKDSPYGQVADEKADLLNLN